MKRNHIRLKNCFSKSTEHTSAATFQVFSNPQCQAHEACSDIGTIELQYNISFQLTGIAKGTLRLKEFDIFVHVETW